VKIMPTSDAYNKTDRLQEIQLLFSKNPKRLFTTPEIARSLNVSDDTALRYLNDLSVKGHLPVEKKGRYWVLMEDAKMTLPAITFTFAEATALSIAGRLLSQIHDEHNVHVTQALLKLVKVLPDAVAAHQHKIVEIAKERQQHRPDRSAIFEALAIGWVKQRRVQLRYTTAEGKTFTCTFDPYLFEPTGIGRTIYVIGHSTPPDELRTFKLERIEQAVLLDEPFALPLNFDGPGLLKSAWVVMFGDREPVTIKLRFTSRVVTRLKETLWHPTQQIRETAEGCEMTLTIGDPLEIENWIRGWGPDCEVLAPKELREKLIEDLLRSARTYGIDMSSSVPPGEVDDDLFDTFFGSE
jgi:predicted DNA-binding transcriptional regulator YafY